MTNYKELETKYEFDVYPKRDLVIVKGKNAKIWDNEGKEYIDCVGGHGSANIGHCNEHVIKAINEQSSKLITCTGVFYNDTRALLLEKLVEIAPASLTKAFLCNSGTEAVEAAIKFARFTAKNRSDDENKDTEKTEFICAMRSFHGRSMGALSATFNPKYRQDFQPLVPGFSFVPFNNIEKLTQKVKDSNGKTAGIILEVIQGEGGVNIGNKEYFTQVRKLCDDNDILLIIDEVQTGFCRTGKMFACEHFNLQPDIMCLAKSIAGGFPMGAVLCSDKVEIPLGRHGTTFGGNPLACAAAIAAIDFMLEEKLDKQAEEKGKYFVEKLNKQVEEHGITKIREIRQLGLMIGMEIKEKSQPHILSLIDEGIVCMPAGPTVLRLLPPLTISYEELDFVVEKLVKVLG